MRKYWVAFVAYLVLSTLFLLTSCAVVDGLKQFDPAHLTRIDICPGENPVDGDILRHDLATTCWHVDDPKASINNTQAK